MDFATPPSSLIGGETRVDATYSGIGHVTLAETVTGAVAEYDLETGEVETGAGAAADGPDRDEPAAAETFAETGSEELAEDDADAEPPHDSGGTGNKPPEIPRTGAAAAEPGDNLPSGDETPGEYYQRMIDRFGANKVLGAMNPREDQETDYNSGEASDPTMSERPYPIEPDEEHMRELFVDGSVDDAMNEDITIPAGDIVDRLIDDINAAEAAKSAEPADVPEGGDEMELPPEHFEVFEDLPAGTIGAHTYDVGEDMVATLDEVWVRPERADVDEARAELVEEFVRRAFDSGADRAEIPLGDPALYGASIMRFGLANVDITDGEGRVLSEQEVYDVLAFERGDADVLEPPYGAKLVIDLNSEAIRNFFSEDEDE